MFDVGRDALVRCVWAAPRMATQPVETYTASDGRTLRCGFEQWVSLGLLQSSPPDCLGQTGGDERCGVRRGRGKLDAASPSPSVGTPQVTSPSKTPRTVERYTLPWMSEARWRARSTIRRQRIHPLPPAPGAERQPAAHTPECGNEQAAYLSPVLRHTCDALWECVAPAGLRG